MGTDCHDTYDCTQCVCRSSASTLALTNSWSTLSGEFFSQFAICFRWNDLLTHSCRASQCRSPVSYSWDALATKCDSLAAICEINWLLFVPLCIADSPKPMPRCTLRSLYSIYPPCIPRLFVTILRHSRSIPRALSRQSPTSSLALSYERITNNIFLLRNVTGWLKLNNEDKPPTFVVLFPSLFFAQLLHSHTLDSFYRTSLFPPLYKISSPAPIHLSTHDDQWNQSIVDRNELSDTSESSFKLQLTHVHRFDFASR